MAIKAAFSGNFIERIKDIVSGDKGRKIVIALALSAMLLLLLSTMSCTNEDGKTNSQYHCADIEETERRLEARILKLVSEIDGVGDPSGIEVMITLNNTATEVYEKNRKTESVLQSAESGSTQSNVNETEVVLAGSGKEPLHIGAVQPVVRGAAVVCSGASDPLVRERVANAVSRALDVGISHIYITY